MIHSGKGIHVYTFHDFGFFVGIFSVFRVFTIRDPKALGFTRTPEKERIILIVVCGFLDSDSKKAHTTINLIRSISGVRVKPRIKSKFSSNA